MLSLRARLTRSSSTKSGSQNKKSARTNTTTATAANHKRKSQPGTSTFSIHLARWKRKLSPKKAQHETDVEFETHAESQQLPPELGPTARRGHAFIDDATSDMASFIYHAYPFRLVKYQNTHYFFDCEDYTWVPLRSLRFYQELAAQLADPYYVPVQDEDDAESVNAHSLARIKAPYHHRHLREIFRQIDLHIEPEHKSYCINGSRYRIILDDQKQVDTYGDLFSGPGSTTIPQDDTHGEWDDVPGFKSFAVAPLASNIHYNYWKRGSTSKAENFLADYFDDQQLEILRWFVGNGLCDPIARPRLLYIHARDAIQRKAITTALISLLRGTVYCLSPDTDITSDEILGCVRSRFLFLGDLDLEKMDVVKCARLASLTSSPDGIVYNGGFGQATCSAFATGEFMWSRKSNLQQAWFLSRVVVVTARDPGTEPYVSSSSLPRVVRREWSMEDITQFACNCLITRLDYEHEPPLSLDDALKTVLGDSLSVLSKQRVVFQPDATPAESFEGSCILATECGVSRADIVARLYCLSPRFIGAYLDCDTIRGVAPQPISPRSQHTTIIHEYEDGLDDWSLQHQQQQVEVTDYDYEEEYRRAREFRFPLRNASHIMTDLRHHETSEDESSAGGPYDRDDSDDDDEEDHDDDREYDGDDDDDY